MNRLLLSAALLVLEGTLTAAVQPADNQQNTQKPAVSTPPAEIQPAAPKDQVAGPQWVKQIDQDLKEGRYSQFLTMEEEWYQKGAQKNQWKPLAEGDQQLTQKYNTPEGKKLFDEITGKVDQFEDELQTLKKNRDTALAKGSTGLS